jgi:predicted transcriptional regulator
VAKKDFLAFRINPELKRQLEEIADEEQRSISQVCELFLAGAVEDCKKEGPQFIQRLLARQKNKTKK